MNHDEQHLGHNSGEDLIGSSKESTLVIPVIQEQLNVTKKIIETGRVKVSKRVIEHQEQLEIPLNYDEVHVERIPINQYLDNLPEAVRYEGDTMIIPILKEVIVKRILLVEEIRVSKRQLQKIEKQQVTLRKEEIDIERKQV